MNKYKMWVRIFILVNMLGICSIYLINFIIDPNQANNIFEYKFNKYKFRSSNYSFINSIKNSNYTLVLGTSRSRRISPEIINDNVVNANFAYGSPINIYQLLKQLDSDQVKRINKIIYNISYHVFHNKHTFKINLKDKNAYFNLDYLNIRTLFHSYQTIFNNLYKEKDELPNIMSPKGFIINIENKKKKIFKPTKLNKLEFKKNLKKMYKLSQLTDKSFNSLGKIDKFCKDHNISIIYFTDPLNDYYLSFLSSNNTLRNISQLHYRLLNVIDGYYAFNYLEKFSNNYTFYSDYSHLNSRGTQYLFNNFFNKKHYITKNNINTYNKFLMKKIILSRDKFMSTFLKK